MKPKKCKYHIKEVGCVGRYGNTIDSCKGYGKDCYDYLREEKMLQAMQNCPCGRPLYKINFGVRFNKDHATFVNLLMCRKCRVVEITKKQMDLWFVDYRKEKK